MKMYIPPEIYAEEVDTKDVITASPGTETPVVNESNGVWDLDIGSQK